MQRYFNYLTNIPKKAHHKKNLLSLFYIEISSNAYEYWIKNKYMRFCILVLIIFLASCGGGSPKNSPIEVSNQNSSTTNNNSNNSDNSNNQSLTETYDGLNGSFQKGPLIFGSYLWVSELNEQLSSTGKTYVSQTNDDLGRFTLKSQLSSNLLEIVGDGYYMDETTGALSDGRVLISGLVDLDVDDTPNINILTTIQSSRLKKLMESNSYTSAFSQSQEEVLNAFGINTIDINNFTGFSSMQIDGSSDSDAILLAVSSVLMNIASTKAATSGASKSAELTSFLSKFSKDLENDGSLSSEAMQNDIQTAAQSLNVANIKTNVETYYQNRGDTIVAPKFEEWIDTNGSGIIPRRIIEVGGLSFNDALNSEALSVITSNSLSLASIPAGLNVFVEADKADSIVKNNDGVSGTNSTAELISGLYTTVNQNETIALRTTTGSFGSTETLSLKIGSSNYSWNVSARMPTIQYKSPDGNFPFPGSGIPGDDSEKYHAFPISITRNSNIKYLGSSFYGEDMMFGGSFINKLSIFSDNAGSPGNELISTTNFGDYFGSTVLKDSNGTEYSDLSQLGTEAYFGSQGLNVTVGQNLWIVIELKEARDPGSKGNSPVGHSQRKVSSDGTNWSEYQGNANGRYSEYMPMVLLTD